MERSNVEAANVFQNMNFAILGSNVEMAVMSLGIFAIQKVYQVFFSDFTHMHDHEIRFIARIDVTTVDADRLRSCVQGVMDAETIVTNKTVMFAVSREYFLFFLKGINMGLQ